jgi:hypothetical protein
MATDYSATSISSGVAQQSSLNAEFAAIQAALERLLNVYGDSANGTNAMQTDLDMNSNKLLNVPAPTLSTDVVRLGDLSTADAATALTTTIVDAAAKYASDNVEGALAEVLTLVEAASNAAGEGADLIGIEDALGLLTGTTVEEGLAEIITALNTHISNLASTATDKGAALVGNAIQIVSTLAVAKTLTGTATRDLYISGKTARGDGYEGLFFWDPSDQSAAVAQDANNALFIPPSTDTTGGSGVWVRYNSEGVYNPLWWRLNDTEVDMSLIMTRCLATVSQINAGQAGRRVRIPNRPDAVPGGPNLRWEWSSQVEVEDTVGTVQAGFKIYGDPVWVQVTANITSLYRTGYRAKARVVEISDHHVDVNGKAITAVILRGESHMGGDHDIEVADDAGGGTCQYIVKHDDAISNLGVGSGVGIYQMNFYNLNDSGIGVVQEAALYSNFMVNSHVHTCRAGKNATYGVELVSSEGKIQFNNIEGMISESGLSTSTAMVRLEEAGNSITKNHVSKLFGSNLTTYGVSMAFASGLIFENVFEVMPSGWATGAFNVRDDGSNILNNSYIEDFAGSFTGTLTGCTTSPTGAVKYTKNGSHVILDIPAISGTSNATTMTITGAPSAIRPLTTTNWVLCRVTDNSGAANVGLVRMNTSGVLEFRSNVGGGTFTASGTKSVDSCSITFDID